MTDTAGKHTLADFDVLLRCATDLLQLIRPVAAGMAGFQVLVGATMASPVADPVRITTFLPAVIIIILVVAVANVVNDVKDLAADAVNRTDRPLPSGRLSVRAAWTLACTCGAGALLTSWGQPGGLCLVAVLLTLSIAYSYFFKSTVLAGNLLVSLLAAFPLLYGGYIAHVPWQKCTLGSGLIFLFMLAYEVLKTIRDADADKSAGYVTISTFLGHAHTAQVFRMLFGAYATVAVAIPLAMRASPFYFAIMVPAGIMPTVVAALILPLTRSLSAVQATLKTMVWTWLPGLLALWLAFR